MVRPCGARGFLDLADAVLAPYRPTHAVMPGCLVCRDKFVSYGATSMTPLYAHIGRRRARQCSMVSSTMMTRSGAPPCGERKAYCFTAVIARNWNIGLLRLR